LRTLRICRIDRRGWAPGHCHPTLHRQRVGGGAAGARRRSGWLVHPGRGACASQASARHWAFRASLREFR